MQSEQRNEWLLVQLITLAEARGADVGEDALELYATALSEFPDQDIRAVLGDAARHRGEFEKAWPPLPDLVRPLEFRERQRIEKQQAASKRQCEIDEFWATAPEWMEITGFDESELMRRFPSFKGTKPS